MRISYWKNIKLKKREEKSDRGCKFKIQGSLIMCYVIEKSLALKEALTHYGGSIRWLFLIFFLI